MTILAIALLLAGQAAPASPAPPTPADIVAAAPASEWVAIAPDDLLIMELAPNARGRARRVVIQLMPPPLSQGWVGNIRLLARARWWDGTSVNRVQDNYVVQWGDATEKKPLPAGLASVPESGYEGFLPPDNMAQIPTIDVAGRVSAVTQEPATVRWANTRSPYALELFVAGWPEATNGDRRWPVHCYGMVGVGRNNSPDAGTGAELYTVIGHAPRHLDRNIALVGRVIEGIEHLSSLPRGTGALGFYESAGERVPIVSARLGGDFPASERPRFEYLSTEGDSFTRYAHARANRRDAFFIRPAGGADICNVPVPVRRSPAR